MEPIKELGEEIFKLCDQFILERSDQDLPENDGIIVLEILQEELAEVISKIISGIYTPPFIRTICASRGEAILWTMEMLHYGKPELTAIIRKISGKFQEFLVILEAIENPAF